MSKRHLVASKPGAAAAAAEEAKVGPALREMVRECVHIFATRNGNTDDLLALVPAPEQSQFIQSFAVIACEAGCPLKLVRSALARSMDAASRAGKLPSSGISGPSFVTRFMTAFADVQASDWLADVVKPLTSKALRDDKPLELDPNVADALIINRNAENLTERVKDFLKHMTQKEKLEHIPGPLSDMLRAVAEVARQRQEGEDITSVVGVAFVRSCLTALMENPKAYGINEPLSGAAQRNLSVVMAVVERVARGEAFTPQEPFMMIMNECVAMNAWRLQHFFVKLSQGSPTTPAWHTVAPGADLEAQVGIASDIDYQMLYHLFSKRTDECFDCFKNPQAAAEFRHSSYKLKHFHRLAELPQELKGTAPATITFSVRIGEDVYEEEVTLPQAQVSAVTSGLTKKLDKLDKKQSRMSFSGGARLLHRSRASFGVSAEAEEVAATKFRIFGTPLHEVLEQEREVRPDAQIPQFVEQIADFITLKGLDQEGIFRISGVKGEMEQMEADIDRGRPLVIDRDHTNVNNLTGLLKKYLRDLPAPLCTVEKYDEFLEVIRQYPGDDAESKEASFEALRVLFAELPLENRTLLEAVFRMNYHVQNNSDVNKMTANNLGVVFGPNILYKGGGDSMASLTNAEDVKNVTARMCEGYPVIFREFVQAEEDKAAISVFYKRIVAAKNSVRNMILARHSKEPDAEISLVTCAKNSVNFWDPSTGTKRGEVDLGDFVYSIAEDDKGFVWCSTDSMVHVLSLETFQIAKSISERGGGTMIAKVNTEMWLNAMTASHISCFHASKQEFFRQLPGHEEGINVMKFIGDGRVWASTMRNSIVVFDIRTGQILNDLKNIHMKSINTICEIDGRVCCGSADGALSFYNAETMQYERKLEAHDGDVKFATSWDGLLWTCSWDMTIRVWDTTKLRLKHELTNLHSDGVTGMLFFQRPSTKDWIMWTSSGDRTLVMQKVFPAVSRVQSDLGSGIMAPLPRAGSLASPLEVRAKRPSASPRGRGLPLGPSRGGLGRGFGGGPNMRGKTPPGLAQAIAQRAPKMPS